MLYSSSCRLPCCTLVRSVTRCCASSSAINSRSRSRLAKRCRSVSADRRLSWVLRLYGIDAKKASCSCVRPDPSGQHSHGPKPHRMVSFASPSSDTRSEVMVFAASDSRSPRTLAPDTQRVASNSTVNDLDASFLNISLQPTCLHKSMALRVFESLGLMRPADTPSTAYADATPLLNDSIDKVRHRWLVPPHVVLILHTEIHTHDLHRTACVECFHEQFTIKFRLTVAFDEIRGTKLDGLLSCAVFLKHDRCAAVQPFSAAVDPVTVGIHRVALQPTFPNCSSRSRHLTLQSHERSSVISRNATLCSSEHRIVCFGDVRFVFCAFFIIFLQFSTFSTLICIFLHFPDFSFFLFSFSFLKCFFFFSFLGCSKSDFGASISSRFLEPFF